MLKSIIADAKDHMHERRKAHEGPHTMQAMGTFLEGFKKTSHLVSTLPHLKKYHLP